MRGGMADRERRSSARRSVRRLPIRINTSECLDCCEVGPTMVISPKGAWCHDETFEDIDEVLDTHGVGGGRVERLMLAVDQ